MADPVLGEYMALLARAYSNLPARVDLSERFTIPEVNTSIEGNKTFITNWRDILKVINRSEQGAHVAKYLAGEFATSSLEEGSRLVLQGKFSFSAVNRAFRAYCQAYVICPECGKPDTHLVKDDRLTIKVCEACGARQSATRS